MKRFVKSCSVGVMVILALLPASAAWALEIEAPDGPTFSKSTSNDTVYIDVRDVQNEKTNKDAAYLPPTFGSPSADMPGSGELLTPNLAGNILPTLAGSDTNHLPPNTPATSYNKTRYTQMNSDYYYSDDSIGRLKIPALDLNVKVYQMADLDTLKKGVGHFKDTSLWDGNVCIAGHNRGVNTYFSKLDTLEKGDRITYTTKLGSRTYKVFYVGKIKETDFSHLEASRENRITLITCVKNQPAYRWCIQAKEIE